MRSWKTAEEATISFYETVELFQKGAVVPNPRSQYGDDAISTLEAQKHYELKTCYSTFHHDQLYELGYDANETAYIRLDQLKRYYLEDLARPELKRLLYIDRRILDLSHYSIHGVKEYVSTWVTDPYEIRKIWTVTITNTRELHAMRKRTVTSTVPAKTRKDYSNDPKWDGKLLNFPTSELRTINLTSQVPIIGEEKLLEHR
jgi:hypothetical protein